MINTFISSLIYYIPRPYLLVSSPSDEESNTIDNISSLSDEPSVHGNSNQQRLTQIDENQSPFTNEKMYWEVLDHGFVECQDIFGDELVIVNTARVSFGKRKHAFDVSDDRLIGYLLRHQHYSPFRHVMFRFHIKAPEFVMRQWYKHVVGCEWTSSMPSQLHGWNEISGRYVESFDYYTPDTWRQQSNDKKQGSDGNVDTQEECQDIFQKTMNYSFLIYLRLLAKGVAKEQARIVLPLNVYTEVIWTPSLQALFHFVKLRNEEHAQYEIREYAKIFADLLSLKFPSVWKHMMNMEN